MMIILDFFKRDIVSWITEKNYNPQKITKNMDNLSNKIEKILKKDEKETQDKKIDQKEELSENISEIIDIIQNNYTEILAGTPASSFLQDTNLFSKFVWNEEMTSEKYEKKLRTLDVLLYMWGISPLVIDGEVIKYDLSTVQKS